MSESRSSDLQRLREVRTQVLALRANDEPVPEQLRQELYALIARTGQAEEIDLPDED